MRWLTLLMLTACGGGDPPRCDDYPSTPQPWSGVLSNTERCGFYGLAVDEHMVVNTYLFQPDIDCTAVLGASIDLRADPIYTNLGDDGPKYTWDIVGIAATEGDFDTVSIDCDDSTWWEARLRVE